LHAAYTSLLLVKSTLGLALSFTRPQRRSESDLLHNGCETFRTDQSPTSRSVRGYLHCNARYCDSLAKHTKGRMAQPQVVCQLSNSKRTQLPCLLPLISKKNPLSYFKIFRLWLLRPPLRNIISRWPTFARVYADHFCCSYSPALFTALSCSLSHSKDAHSKPLPSQRAIQF
jgi:hypothetical protein